MTDIRPKNFDPGAKPSLFAGIDVGAEELVLVIRKDGKPFDPQEFANRPSGRARLVKKLAKLPGIVVCIEATGAYHFDLAVALHDAGVLLMVVNPKASHNFAKVLMKNSETDAVDAHTLAEYAARMDFVAWTRPSNEKLALRCFSPRIGSLTDQKAAADDCMDAGGRAMQEQLPRTTCMPWPPPRKHLGRC
jgi:transposase